MLCLAGAFLFSVYMAFQKGLSDKRTGFSSLFPIFLIASIITMTLVQKEELFNLETSFFSLIVFMGVFNAVSFLFFTKSLEHIQSSTISVIILASPIMTAAAVVVGKGLSLPFFAGEIITTYILLGGTAILFGAFLVISEENT